MKPSRVWAPRRALVVVALVASAGAAWALQGRSQLIMNGAVVSSNVRIIGGEPYVPVRDMARALGMVVAPQGTNYLMGRMGGANQIANDNVGKMGQEVFTGKWRFAVVSMDRAATYKQSLTTGYRKEVSAQGGDELLVLHCRVKNGTQKKDKLVYDKWDGSNTALTDTAGHSYEPVIWDVRADDHAPEGASFLPGAAVEFNLVFDVPRGATPKDLVFTAIRYDDRASFDQKRRPPTDIRYSLR